MRKDVRPPQLNGAYSLVRLALLRIGQTVSALAAISYVALGSAIFIDGETAVIYRLPAVAFLLFGVASLVVLMFGVRAHQLRVQVLAATALLMGAAMAWLGLGAVGYPSWPESFNFMLALSAAAGIVTLSLGKEAPAPSPSAV